MYESKEIESLLVDSQAVLEHVQLLAGNPIKTYICGDLKKVEDRLKSIERQSFEAELGRGLASKDIELNIMRARYVIFDIEWKCLVGAVTTFLIPILTFFVFLIV